MPPIPQHYCPVCDRVHDVDLHTGKCHICKLLDRKISYCPGCGHWMCDPCRGEAFKRSWEALKALLGIKSQNCCYPIDGPFHLGETYGHDG